MEVELTFKEDGKTWHSNTRKFANLRSIAIRLPLEISKIKYLGCS